MRCIIFCISAASIVNCTAYDSKKTNSDKPVTTIYKDVGPHVANKSNATDYKERTLQLVNQIRKNGAKCGQKYFSPASQLSWSEHLEKIALNHARDMYQRDHLSHAGGDSSDLPQRLNRANYQWRQIGENIAYDTLEIEHVIHGWVRSPNHCVNIMTPEFSEIAVARMGPYWVQLFALPK